jgi:hypothetical protein
MERATMPKLKPVMDDLRVESFDTRAVAKEKGTVFGREYTDYGYYTCPGWGARVEATCGCSFGCRASCNHTEYVCTDWGTCYTCPNP